MGSTLQPLLITCSVRAPFVSYALSRYGAVGRPCPAKFSFGWLSNTASGRLIGDCNTACKTKALSASFAIKKKPLRIISSFNACSLSRSGTMFRKGKDQYSDSYGDGSA